MIMQVNCVSLSKEVKLHIHYYKWNFCFINTRYRRQCSLNEKNRTTSYSSSFFTLYIFSLRVQFMCDGSCLKEENARASSSTYYLMIFQHFLQILMSQRVLPPVFSCPFVSILLHHSCVGCLCSALPVLLSCRSSSSSFKWLLMATPWYSCCFASLGF